MQHGTSRVFQQSYLSRHISADVQAAYRGYEPQVALMRAATGLLASKDKRRPWELTPEQQEKARNHPKIKVYRDAFDEYKKWVKHEFQSLRRVKEDPELRDLYEEYNLLRRNIRNETVAQERAYLEEIKAKFREEQPLKDVQRQLDGLPMDEKADDKQAVVEEFLFPEHVHAISSLLTFLDSTDSFSKAENERRVEAVEAVASFCRMREICPNRGPRQPRATPGADIKADKQTLPETLAGTPALQCKPQQCSFCLRDKQRPWPMRVKEYARRDVLKRHIERKHQDRNHCPECGFLPDHQNHLRLHGEKEHSLLL